MSTSTTVRRQRHGVALAAVALLALAVPLTALPATPSAATSQHQQGQQPRLTNLAHLDWLSVPVTPPTQADHTTYRLADEPAVGVLWTYAEPNPDGTFHHVGGGAYDPATDTWGQGAFNADDVSRAAVVYLRDWRATGSTTSRSRRTTCCAA